MSTATTVTEYLGDVRRLSDLDQKTIVALMRSAGKAAAQQQAK